MYKIRAVFILVAVAAAAADLSGILPSIPVPTTLEGATPADVLLYLYDVVLTPYMTKIINGQGHVMYGNDCPGGMSKLSDGTCPPVTAAPDLSVLYDYS